ncbi:hypothetical protein [Arcobacter sp. FWKO B]|uniref:hypothetical protein n=1 Tax=Arcobacter sp. FWKO B TaxID=2593672 RepID=UPI0018A37CD6|nr:hypothetical protein [Arcobacter sp. FWKO B]QOG11624.1 hypothetical protein FWKOB_02430 [Arcobacter sp. FWKO B]
MARNIQIIVLFIILFLIQGCMPKNDSFKKTDIKQEVTNINQLSENDFLGVNNFTRSTPPPPLILPSPYKKPSPFDGKTFSISAANQPITRILYLIAQDAGVNLILDQDMDENQLITLNISNAPLQKVLDHVMNLSGCYYTIDGNMLHVKATMTKIFEVPYIKTLSSYRSSVGGDVISGNSGSSGLQGQFTLNFNNSEEVNDFYKQLENNIQTKLSENGKYIINKFTGIISVTDKKTNVDNIEEIINNIIRLSSKTITIEAKIFEVILNDSHQLGISWSNIWHNIAKGGTLSVSQPLGLTGTAASLELNRNNLNVLLQAINTSGSIETLSNPRISVSNGQSALISSGKIVPFWEKEVTYSTSTTTSNIPTVTYQRRDVLDGISLGVTPVVLTNGNILPKFKS